MPSFKLITKKQAQQLVHSSFDLRYQVAIMELQGHITNTYEEVMLTKTGGKIMVRRWGQGVRYAQYEYNQ